jgi:RimJ/RimL family protein N-acetyltransferase
MQARSRWPRAETIETQRLMLEPLRVDHAEEMLSVLGDHRLYTYTGWRAAQSRGAGLAVRETGCRAIGRRVAGLAELDYSRKRDPARCRDRSATISAEQSSMSAELAWVLGVAHQGRGYATEAISAIVAWLRRHPVDTFAAHIRSGHEASEGVARRVGLDTGLADARRGRGLRCSTLVGNSDAVGSRASFL